MFDGASKFENEAMMEHSREQERARRNSSDIIKKQEERIKDLEILVNAFRKENENLMSKLDTMNSDHDSSDPDEIPDIPYDYYDHDCDDIPDVKALCNRIDTLEKNCKSDIMKLNDRIDAIIRRLDKHEYGISFR